MSKNLEKFHDSALIDSIINLVKQGVDDATFLNIGKMTLDFIALSEGSNAVYEKVPITTVVVMEETGYDFPVNCIQNHLDDYQESDLTYPLRG